LSSEIVSWDDVKIFQSEENMLKNGTFVYTSIEEYAMRWILGMRNKRRIGVLREYIQRVKEKKKERAIHWMMSPRSSLYFLWKRIGKNIRFIRGIPISQRGIGESFIVNFSLFCSLREKRMLLKEYSFSFQKITRMFSHIVLKIAERISRISL
jgi:hypothetical protein